jgi:hypothetical protein
VRFKGQPVDDDAFFDSAPFRLGDTLAIARPAADVWADLTADDTLRWCRLIKGVEWTSPRPFAVGTTRVVRALGGAVVLGERYFRWEEGRRKSFYVEELSVPLFKRFAEDYVVEPDGEGASRFTWRFAGVPRLPGPNKQLLGTLLKDTRKHFGA